MSASARRRSLIATALFVAATGASALPLAAQTAPRGRWTLDHVAGRTTAELTLRTLDAEARNSSTTSRDVETRELQGLPVALLDGAGDSVGFRFVRDAGTITFTGRAGRGLGIGTYAFVPDERFLAELERRGYGRATDEEAIRFVLGDIGRAYVDRLEALHYTRPTTRELVRLGTHGVSLDYLNAMASLGFTTRTATELTRLRDHGVTPEFVKDLRAAGYAELEPAEYVRAVDHGVDAALARDFAAAGYAQLPMATLIRMRDHGVTPAFAKAAREGGTMPTAEELVRARDRGTRE